VQHTTCQLTHHTPLHAQGGATCRVWCQGCRGATARSHCRLHAPDRTPSSDQPSDARGTCRRAAAAW